MRSVRNHLSCHTVLLQIHIIYIVNNYCYYNCKRNSLQEYFRFCDMWDQYTTQARNPQICTLFEVAPEKFLSDVWDEKEQIRVKILISYTEIIYNTAYWKGMAFCNQNRVTTLSLRQSTAHFAGDFSVSRSRQNPAIPRLT